MAEEEQTLKGFMRMCPHPAASQGWKDGLTWLFFRCFPVVRDTSPAPGWGWRYHSIPWAASGLLCRWPLALHQPHLEPWGFSRAKLQSRSLWAGVFCWFMSPRQLGPGSGMFPASLVFRDGRFVGLPRSLLQHCLHTQPCSLPAPQPPSAFSSPASAFQSCKTQFGKPRAFCSF